MPFVKNISFLRPFRDYLLRILGGVPTKSIVPSLMKYSLVIEPGTYSSAVSDGYLLRIRSPHDIFEPVYSHDIPTLIRIVKRLAVEYGNPVSVSYGKFVDFQERESIAGEITDILDNNEAESGDI